MLAFNIVLVVAAVIVAVVIVVVALLAVPLHFAFAIDGPRREEWRRARFTWLFGLVHVDVLRRRGATKARRRRVREHEHEGEPEEHAVTGRRGARARARRAWAALQTPGVLPRVMRLCVRLVRSVHSRDLEIIGVVGFDDPADTGRLWAVVGPLSGTLTSVFPNVRVMPAFLEETLAVRGSGTLRVVPLEVVAHVVAFLLSPAIVRAVWRATHVPVVGTAGTPATGTPATGA